VGESTELHGAELQISSVNGDAVPSPKKTLKERLSRYRQIKISVIGRKSSQTISIPVWSVLDGEKFYLLPVQGSDAQW